MPAGCFGGSVLGKCDTDELWGPSSMLVVLLEGDRDLLGPEVKCHILALSLPNPPPRTPPPTPPYAGARGLDVVAAEICFSLWKPSGAF